MFEKSTSSNAWNDQVELLLEIKRSKIACKGQTTLPEEVRAVSQIDAGYMPRGGVSGGETLIHITTSVLELSVMLKRQNQASLSVEMMHAAIAEAATL